MMNSNQNAPSNPKELIRQEWTGAAPLWQKWNAKFVIQTSAATELVVRGADVAAGMNILDLASGTGEPALSLARAVGAQGRVVASDLVPEMLEFARHNAAVQGLTNLEFRIADAEQLPFSDGRFDRVTCRFGVMLFPDIPRALAEIRRVLKPGGRICFAVFGSMQENPIFAVSLGPFLKRAKMPPPPPDAPHMFRFADAAKLENALTSAGFRDVRTQKYPVIFPWPGSAEESWEATRDLAAQFKKALAAISPAEVDEATREALAGIRTFQAGDRINLPGTVIIAVAAV
jgi:ubiquinone/menaquinone biosynthesis C-methylase UbiE